MQIKQEQIRGNRRKLHVVRLERRAVALSDSEWVAFTKEKFQWDLKEALKDRLFFDSVTRPWTKMPHVDIMDKLLMIYLKNCS